MCSVSPTPGCMEMLNDLQQSAWTNVQNTCPRLKLVRDLLETRLLLFLARGWLAARDFAVSKFLGLFGEAMDSFKPEYWPCVLHDSTSPKLLLVGLSVDVLRRGLGRVEVRNMHKPARNDDVSRHTEKPGTEQRSH